jgi:hypothetical protein
MAPQAVYVAHGEPQHLRDQAMATPGDPGAGA